MALISLLALFVVSSSADVSSASTSVLALRGGASMPQTVLAATGSALSVSGFAAIVDSTWLDKLDSMKEPPKRFGVLPRKPPPPPIRRRRMLSRLGRGAFLVGWGFSKLAIARLSGPVLHTFARLNVPAILGLVSLQLKSGRVGFMPLELQGVLAGLYACVALGVTKIPRLGNDKYPDLFLEYLPGKLHLV